MTAVEVQLSTRESDQVKKLITSDGFSVLMRVFRSKRDKAVFDLGQVVMKVPGKVYGNPQELKEAHTVYSDEARKWDTIVTQLESIDLETAEGQTYFKIEP